MQKIKPTPVDNLVYVVQDYQQQLCGVYSTLANAAEQYNHVLAEGLVEEDIQAMFEEYGEDFHDEMDSPPCIVVYRLDSTWVWSYDSLSEIKNALEQGEQYD